MRAVRYHAGRVGVSVESVPVPEPAPGEVLVKVKAAGLCGTDVSIAYHQNSPLVFRSPITVGHEAAGVIWRLGEGVTKWSIGDRIVVCPIHTCGRCEHCRRGASELCEANVTIGLHRDGALADYVAVPAETLVALPDDVPFALGAVMTDAVATPFFALTERARLQPGESIAIFGVGGLGQHAVQIAVMRGASRIIAVDVRPAALEIARAVGATDVVDGSDGDVGKSVIAANEARGVDVAADFTGSPQAITAGFDALAKGGRLIVVGWGSKPITLPPSQTFVPRKVSILASGGFRKDTIDQLTGFVARGELALDSSISHMLPLEDAAAGLSMLRDPDVPTRRVVVTP
jgi:2-desacetyl-2-hydroxyethyl bacteriochlorophyllide A dehydrogenase